MIAGMADAMPSLGEILARLRSRAPALRAEGVTGLAVFGSRSRGDARTDSDLDVLVDVEPNSRFSLLNLIGVEHIVQDCTGLRTQATMRRSLEPRMAARIADDLIEVF
jgi:predicted nucleotidyltransferase